jgi:hypothetical protein
MLLPRVVSWIVTVVLTSGVAVWFTTDGSSDAAGSVELRAFDQLVAVAAAHGHQIIDGGVSYAHVGDTVIAHAPLDGIAGYRDADFQAGVLITAILVAEPRPGRIPNGAYVVQVKLEPGSDVGIATYFDAQGRAAATVPAYSRRPDDINAVFPGAYDPAARALSSITSTLVWHDDHWAVGCAGWQPYRVIYY